MVSTFKYMGNTSPDLRSKIAYLFHKETPISPVPMESMSQNTLTQEQPHLGTISIDQSHLPENTNNIEKPTIATSYGTAVFLPYIRTLLTNCRINPDIINPVMIGEGGNHKVFQSKKEITPPFVVKIPKGASLTALNAGHVDEQAQIAKIKKAFPGFSVPTEVRTASDSNEYIIIQQAIEGNPVTNHTTDPSVRQQLQNIVSLNNRLYEETGESLDFVGMPGFTSWIKRQFKKILLRKSDFEVSNILIDKNTNKLCIIDTDVLRTRNVPIKTAITSHIGLFVNRVLMKWYFGMDIKKNNRTFQTSNPMKIQTNP